MTAEQAYKLLQNMIEIPSLSREETAVADFIQNYLEYIYTIKITIRLWKN